MMMVNDLLSATASKSPSDLLSLDISVAFDTIDHHHLLHRAKDLFGSTARFFIGCARILLGANSLSASPFATLGR